MKVDDRVNPMLRTSIDDAIKMLEALSFKDSRTIVILEMPIIYCNANAIQAQRFEKFCVFLAEEILEKLG